MGTTTSSAIDTFGWDCVFAVRVEHVNQAIARRGAYPAGLDLVPDPSLGCETLTRLALRFDPWSIVAGGSGTNLRMKLPLRDVHGTARVGAQELPFRCPDIDAFVRLRLAFLDETEAPARPSEGAQPCARRRLVADTSGTPEEPATTLERIRNLVIEPALPPEASALRYEIEAALADWCSRHLDEFRHVFALIDLFDRGEEDGWAFLKPRSLGYAYVEDDSGGLLACLGMTCTSGAAPPAQQQVSAYAIPAGCEAGLLLSARRMFEDMVLPGLPKAWPKARPQDFAVMEDGLGLVMTAPRVDLPDVPHDGRHAAHLTSLRMRLEADTLVVDTVSVVEVSPGVEAKCTATHWYRVESVQGKNGMTLNWTQTKEDHLAPEIHNTRGLNITSAVLAIIGAIVGLLVAILTVGLALLVGLIVAALLGSMAIALQIIDLVHGDDAPPLDALVTNATSWLTWTGGDDFRATSARLHGCLQLGGFIAAPAPT